MGEYSVYMYSGRALACSYKCSAEAYGHTRII